MKNNYYLRLAVSLILPLLAGGIGSIFTTPAISGWYSTLSKPLLNPPSWVFGPVWTTLFILIGIAFFLVWIDRTAQKGTKRLAIILFLFQLVLNVFWSIIFFGLRNPSGALFEVILLWISILATIVVFYKISKVTFWLLLPYILWVSFAMYLNWALVVLN